MNERTYMAGLFSAYSGLNESYSAREVSNAAINHCPGKSSDGVIPVGPAVQFGWTVPGF